jgi:hypothetical protein
MNYKELEGFILDNAKINKDNHYKEYVYKDYSFYLNFDSIEIWHIDNKFNGLMHILNNDKLLFNRSDNLSLEKYNNLKEIVEPYAFNKLLNNELKINAVAKHEKRIKI